jgi:hypothetical protein
LCKKTYLHKYFHPPSRPSPPVSWDPSPFEDKNRLALVVAFVRISIISLTLRSQSRTKVYLNQFGFRSVAPGTFSAPENFRVNNKSLAPRGGTAKSHDGDN